MYKIKFKSFFILTVLTIFYKSVAQICVQKSEVDMLINLTVKIPAISEHLSFNKTCSMSQWVKRKSLNIIHPPDKNTVNYMRGLNGAGICTTNVSANKEFTTQDKTNTQPTTGRWLLSYSGAMTLVTLITLVTKFMYPYCHISYFLRYKQLLTGVFLLFNFTIVSGQMWNQIKAPSFYHNSKNSPVYINGGSHGQFILESYIVATLSISFFLYLICCLWNILTIFYVFLVYYSQ